MPGSPISTPNTQAVGRCDCWPAGNRAAAKRLWGLERPPGSIRGLPLRGTRPLPPQGAMHTAAPAIQSTKSVPHQSPSFPPGAPPYLATSPRMPAPCPLSSVTDILGAFPRQIIARKRRRTSSAA